MTMNAEESDIAAAENNNIFSIERPVFEETASCPDSPIYCAEIELEANSLWRKINLVIDLFLPVSLRTTKYSEESENGLFTSRNAIICIFLFVSISIFIALPLLAKVAATFSLIGISIGYIVAAPEVPVECVLRVYDKILRPIMKNAHCDYCIVENSRFVATAEKNVRLLLPNPLHDSVLQLISYITRDFIDNWYCTLNKSNDRTFQNHIANYIKDGINRLVAICRGRSVDIAVSASSAIAALLTKHSRNYKKYQRLCSKGEFLKAKNLLLVPFQQERDYLDRISMLLINHLVPEEERSSAVGSAFFKELVSSVFIQNLVDLLAEPEFLNILIVDHLDFEREKIMSQTKNGYSVLRIKLLKGRSVDCRSLSGEHFHVSIVMSGKKLRSRKKKATSDPIFIEEFLFKIPDFIAEHSRSTSVLVQLKQTNTFKENETLGFFEFFPLLVNQNETCRSWYALKRQSDVNDGFGETIGELEIEYAMIKHTEAAEDDKTALFSSRFSTANVSFDEAGEGGDEDDSHLLNLSHVINNNDFFVEFIGFLQQQNAHPYLHLWTCIDEFLKTLAHDETVYDEKIIADTRLIFDDHFGENAAYAIPIDNSDLHLFRSIISNPNVTIKDTIDSLKHTQDYLYKLLADFYFPLFKASPAFEHLKQSFYKEQHEAYLSTNAAASSSNPQPHLVASAGDKKSAVSMAFQSVSAAISQETRDESSVINHAEFKAHLVFEGCKITCRLLDNAHCDDDDSGSIKGASVPSKKSSAPSPPSSSSSVPFLFTPLSVVLAYTIPRSTPSNFYIEVFMRKPIFYHSLCISSYSIVRSYSEIYHMHKQLKKKIPKVEKIFFPEKKTSNEEKRRQMEFQMRNYLTMLIIDDFICDNSVLKEFFAPTEKELAVLVEHSVSSLSASMELSKAVTEMSSRTTRAAKTGASSKKKYDMMSLFKKKKTGRPPNITVTANEDPRASPSSTGCPSATSLDEGANEDLPVANSDENIADVDDGDERATLSSSVAASGANEIEWDENVDAVLDGIFALLYELFDLSNRGRWIRRQLLNAAKQIVRQTQANSVRNLIENELIRRFSFDHLNLYVQELVRKVWPNGRLHHRIPKSAEEREQIASVARSVFLKVLPEPVTAIIGKANASMSLSRLFLMLQFKEYNKLFLYEVLLQALTLIFATPNAASVVNSAVAPPPPSLSIPASTAVQSAVDSPNSFCASVQSAHSAAPTAYST